MTTWQRIRSELRPWLRLLGRRRGRLAMGALLMAATAGAAIGLLALSGWFITATAVTGALLAAGMAASLDVHVPGGGIRFFAVTRTVARYLERLYNHDTVLRLLADLRGGMFRVLARLDAHSLSRRRASEWLNRLTADIDTLDSLYLRLLAPPLVALLAIVTVALLLGVFVPLAGVAVGAILLSLWGWLVVGQSTLGMRASQRRVETLDRLRGRGIEHVQGLAELSAYGTLDMHRAGLEIEEGSLYADQRRLGRVAALGSALVGLGVGLAVLAALWIASLAYTSGALSGPLTVMMPLAVLALGETLGLLPMAFTQFGATRAAARRLNALGAARQRIREPEVPRGLPDGTSDSPPELSLERVSLRYPEALVPALTQVSLVLQPGERLALLGVSGAGKSSVAQLATRQIDPSEGQVRLGGVPLTDLPLAVVRERVGLLTQLGDFFDDSLADNLRLAAPSADDEILWQALAMVELDEWARALPHGLETVVGESGRQLSGGQARRLSLARLVLGDAKVVILDEPFAGLDRPLAERIARRLALWLDGRSALCLFHQLDGQPVQALGIERCVRLSDGRLAQNP